MADDPPNDGSNPPTGDPAKDPPTPPAGDPPPSDGGDDVAALRRRLQESERARGRSDSELRKLQEAQKAAADAELSELDKLKRANAELEERLRGKDAEAQATNLRTAAIAAAARLGFADPEDSVRFIDADSVEWDGATPKNVAALLGEVLKAKPYLKSSTTQPPDLGQGSRGNPPGNGVTDAQVESWVKNADHAAINEHWDAVQAYLKRKG